MMFVVPIFWNK